VQFRDEERNPRSGTRVNKASEGAYGYQDSIDFRHHLQEGGQMTDPNVGLYGHMSVRLGSCGKIQNRVFLLDFTHR
jgi:hypothetical protein